MVEAAKLGAAATRGCRSSGGQRINSIRHCLQGISAFAGPIASGMNSGGGYVTPGGIKTGMDKSNFAPTQLGVNHFNLSTGIPGGNR